VTSYDSVHSLLDYECLLFHCDWLGSDLRIGHFYRDRQVCLGIKRPSGAYNQIFITVRQLRVCWCEALSLTRARVCHNCYWCSPAQSFSGPSPVGLATIFYSLRFEISFFVASYESQGYGGGIRSRLHTGLPQSSPHSRCYNLACIHEKCLLIPLTRKARSVPSRSPWIRSELTAHDSRHIAAERTWSYSKHISRDRYPAIQLSRRSVLQKTASSIAVCWTVFTELLPGNVLIKSVTIFTFKENLNFRLF
jgi:hypothetical protein